MKKEFYTRHLRPSELIDLLKNPYLNQLAQSSVLTSLGTSIGLTILLTVTFSLLRPHNSVVYAPKLKISQSKHALPYIGKGVLAWVKPLLKISEQELVDLIGLDAVVFLRVLAMCRNIFITTAIMGCFILGPINFSNNSKISNDFIMKLTPINTFGRANYGMVFCAWIFNLIIAGFLWWNYRAILVLRRNYYNSSEYLSSLHARTLMLNDIPREYRSDEGINRLIDIVSPTSSFSRTAIARNVKELPKLIKDHDETVRELEKYLTKYLEDPKNLPAYRPKCYPLKNDPARDTYPKGQKLDAIDYLTSRVREIESDVEEVRLAVDNRNPLSYGFASYDIIDECHSIAFAAKNKHPHGTTIVLAPRPNDIIWENMPLTKAQRRTRKIVNNMWVLLLTVLWVVPNALISVFLVSLTNLGHVWEAFQKSLAEKKAWWSFVQGVASPGITSLLYLVLPIIFRRLAVQAGDRTKTARERHVAGKLYTFFVFNFLIVFSMFSTSWNMISTIVRATSSRIDVWRAIYDANFGTATFISLCNSSPFWITWLLQRNLGAAIDFAQLWNLIWRTCVKNFSSPTPRELIELTAPETFDYASYYNYFLFYSTVALCFSVLQPLVLPVCALYFALDYYLKKYLLLYIFVTKIESGGMFWRMFYNRMVFAVILSNFVVFLALWVHGDSLHTEAYTIIPLPLMMLGFKLYCKRNFDDSIHYFATRHMYKNPVDDYCGIYDTKKDRLTTRFGHPALYRPLSKPMIHAKARKVLDSVYRTHQNNRNPLEYTNTSSASGYSDSYALNDLHSSSQRYNSEVPAFDIVPENRLDYSYYQNRQEFSDKFGSMDAIYGKSEEFNRSESPSANCPNSYLSTSRIDQKDHVSPSDSSNASNCYEDSKRNSFLERGDEQRNQFDESVLSSVSAPSPISHGRIVRTEPGIFRNKWGSPQGYGELPQDIEHHLRDHDHIR